MRNTAATALPWVLLFIAAIAINVCLLLIGRERLGNQLAQTALVDGLTGALNRTGFVARAQEAADSCRHNDRVCSMVLMDLDEFKAVNDRHGHAAGDLLLTEFAKIARNNLWPGDVLGRIGGEELVAAIRRADEAMYRAKKDGRDRVVGSAD
ncbi:MAG: GGDEF domain-containing protein [Mycobacterium sp.]